METPQRKQNRLSEYDYGQEGAYFVTLCTQNRARLFQTELPGVGNDLCVIPHGPWAIPGKTDIAKQNDTQVVPYDAIPENTANQIIHKWVRETMNKFPNIAIDQYVVMPDHLHLIVTIKERHAGRSLPDVMQFFKTMTTNEYMRGVRDGILIPFNGKLWQKSYYDHVIRNQQDYNEVWEYIQNNPIK